MLSYLRTIRFKAYKNMKNSFQDFLKKNEKIIGSIASSLSIIMFFSLIEIFISNMQGRSKIFIQPLATAFNGLFWSLYAYGKKDRFFLVPNLLGLILGTLTVMSIFL
ncbi:MAG: membrane protein [Microgenomates group bacterium GW2011_GWC1_39_12]|nr:MAG: membrane protein [Microgenomates group bacterium GW2011_GWC1_39_12]